MTRIEALDPFAFEVLPHRVIFGPGKVAETGDVVRAIGAKRALVVSTRGQAASAERIAGLLGELSAGIFSGAVMHTPVEVTAEAVRVYRAAAADCVVSIGGGSTTGLGKAIALRTGARHVAISTTYAGSEVTPVLGETAGGEKKTQRNIKLLPDAVIYDVELTLSLPPRLSAASGVNAMAHAVEALYARNRNPMTSLMAGEALRLLAESLPRIVRNPGDLEARAHAQQGAWLAGECLAGTVMALHHKLCHVLGGTYDLPHAETHAVVLPHAVAYNAPAAAGAMQRIADAIGSEHAAEGLYDFVRSLGLPAALKDIGMPAEGLEPAVQTALRDPYWNPRAVRLDRLRGLLMRAFEGEPPRVE
jgi:maleylacetate reductase